MRAVRWLVSFVALGLRAFLAVVARLGARRFPVFFDVSGASKSGAV